MLNVDHLTVEYYRREGSLTALKEVSFSLAAGETLGVVGESGSGKSTLATALLRLILPNEGRITQGAIYLDTGRGEQDLLKLPEEAMRSLRGRFIGMIFQDPFTALNPVLRIREQLAEGPRAHGMTVSRSELKDALKHVQLDPDLTLDKYPHQLSGGQRQRVVIAGALLMRPKLLLADEPTTALDVIVQKDILHLLFGLQKEFGMSMIFISHNLGLVAEFTQRLLVLKDGQITEQGPTESLFRTSRDSYTRQLIDSIPRLSRPT